MNQDNPKTDGKKRSFFPAPHRPFDSDQLRDLLTHAERDFLMVLCHLSNRHADNDGWFWHTDKSFAIRNGKRRGFEAYGFGSSTCKRVRKKLIRLGLIETKQALSERGRWPGTKYKINPQIFQSEDHSGLRSEATKDHSPRPP